VEVPLRRQGATQMVNPKFDLGGLEKSDRSADASGVLITDSLLPSMKCGEIFLPTTSKDVWQQA